MCLVVLEHFHEKICCIPYRARTYTKVLKCPSLRKRMMLARIPVIPLRTKAMIFTLTSAKAQVRAVDLKKSRSIALAAVGKSILPHDIKIRVNKFPRCLIALEEYGSIMSKPRTVVDCDVIFKKGVRAKDGKDVGIVVGVSDRNVVIQKGVTREVILPKENVEGFDGHEVFLNVTSEELKRHELKI